MGYTTGISNKFFLSIMFCLYSVSKSLKIIKTFMFSEILRPKMGLIDLSPLWLLLSGDVFMMLCLHIISIVVKVAECPPSRKYFSLDYPYMYILFVKLSICSFSYFPFRRQVFGSDCTRSRSLLIFYFSRNCIIMFVKCL